MLLRGKDAHGYWLPEKRPKADLDPDCLADLDRCSRSTKWRPSVAKRKLIRCSCIRTAYSLCATKSSV